MSKPKNWKAEKDAKALRGSVLSAIEEFTDREGYGPTRADLAAAIGVSERTIQRHVSALIKDGTLEQPSGPRSLRFRI